MPEDHLREPWGIDHVSVGNIFATQLRGAVYDVAHGLTTGCLFSKKGSCGLQA